MKFSGIISDMGLFGLRWELRGVRRSIEELRSAIRAHYEAIHCANETGSNEPSTIKTVNAVISYDDKTKRDAQTESNRQYRVQNSMRWAAWFAFGAAVIYASITACQWHEMRKQTVAAQTSADTALKQLDATTRPWLEVKPEIFQHIWFTVFFDRPHTFIPITCNVVNYGQSPARNVLCNIRIDSVPPVIDNQTKSTNDARLATLCDETNALSRKSPDSGIPVFQHRNPIVINQGAESIDDKAFNMAGTIYMVQGCIDYTYGADQHGRTAFRYLAGIFGADKILHGIPFIKGTVVESGPGHPTHAFFDAGKIDFVRTEGGNYAK